ncbi:hypothetical protein [Streptococcus agalactiae]|nr:hypothetical protein [Streptococcus agalactiae]EFV96590.1 hypothetical protein HMPREF9171_1893 [Streptococcus agalactiae ATCC 13813]EPU46461.1 hypothetical protein SAG0170_08625 [Streptococcus agalactiae LDS 617]EPX08888.1 hypothetical protein SAG0165_07375 [Streptococcus agalactiae MRI Z1-217]MCC9674966.1 hypothetical protein [Streptococcus agalactiae]MCC9744054.1 hypothetical protein [Streptococcus agalactiae]
MKIVLFFLYQKCYERILDMTPIAKLTQNIVVVDLMKQTGWPRERVVKALELMEMERTICIAKNGNLSLRVFEG